MQQKIQTTLQRLVAIPSHSANSDGCHQAIEFARTEIEPHGLHITTDMSRANPWLLATTKPGKAPKILLAAHLDTVPSSHPEQLNLRQEGEKLYGRGTWDMKFAAACYIELLKALKHDLPQYDLGVLFTTDEEIGGQSIIDLLSDGLRSQLVILPDSSQGWSIEERAKGLLTVELTATGKNGHGSRPWEGDNALYKLLPIIHEVRQAYPSYDPDGPTVTVSMLSAGKEKAYTQIPDRAVATLDMRAFEQEDIQKFHTLVSQLAERHDAAIATLIKGHALSLNKDNPFVRSFVHIFEETVGTVAFNSAYGATDGRFFAAHDIPVIVASTRGGYFHGPEEWVHAEDLAVFYELLKRFIDAEARPVENLLAPVLNDASIATA